MRHHAGVRLTAVRQRVRNPSVRLRGHWAFQYRLIRLGYRAFTQATRAQIQAMEPVSRSGSPKAANEPEMRSLASAINGEENSRKGNGKGREIIWIAAQSGKRGGRSTG
ncbi:hypothetical protein Nepgr_001035 [Nepenthes gracilis]|uniref:Uncharacterized protein n=1 Tax=Nepenthes gracilis TaxID=150966 RepID=A0AAD3RX18_NEPGR|nr:hypothetical protein Nepgr_001035 [Nepenthes gracilis]